MKNLDFWSSLVSLLARPLELVAVIVLVCVLRRQLGATIGRVTEFTIGKLFSVKMTPSVPTVGQQAAAGTSVNNRPEDPFHEVHEAAPASQEEQVQEVYS